MTHTLTTVFNKRHVSHTRLKRDLRLVSLQSSLSRIIIFSVCVDSHAAATVSQTVAGPASRRHTHTHTHTDTHTHSPWCLLPSTVLQTVHICRSSEERREKPPSRPSSLTQLNRHRPHTHLLSTEGHGNPSSCVLFI